MLKGMWSSHFFIWIIFILDRAPQTVGFPMGTKCAPLVADLFCYETYFTMSLSGDKNAEVIEAFNPTSRYLDDC